MPFTARRWSRKISLSPIALRPEARHRYIERIRVRARIMQADVPIRQVLIPVANADRLALFAEDVDAHTEIHRVHKLRSLGRQHLVHKVDKPAVPAEEGLHPL